MAEGHDYEFKAEYAKSNRSSCKLCSGGIVKDKLRLAIMVQSPMFDGKVPNWYHPQCFWKRARVEDDTQIHGYDALRWEDQEKIKEKIGAGTYAAGGSGDDSTLNDFAVEYAKSNRSTCRGCDSKIDKDLVRVSKKEFDTQRAKMYGPQDLWHHIDCFVNKRDELGFSSSLDPSKIKGFGVLGKDDKEELIKKLGKGDAKKRKSGAVKDAPPAKKSKEETEEEKLLKEQSKLLWKYRDLLQKEVSNDAMKGLLMYNKQAEASGESKLLDRVSDCLAFGALEPCEECKHGQLVYSGDSYKCTGNVTEWTKCQFTTREPSRRAFKIPKEYHDVDFLKKYKYVKRGRIFPAKTVAAASDKPLAGMSFVIAGKLSKSKPELTKDISALGGQVVSKCTKSTAAVISVKAEVDKMSKGMKEAKAADVQVVDEAFLESASKGGALSLIKSHAICSWGSDPASRIGDVVDGAFKSGARKSMVSKKQEEFFTKSIPSTLKMTVKGGAAVDPGSGLQEVAHVYEERGDPVNAVLGLVDITRGTNSYYKVQVLAADKGSRYWVFRAWGRVGTTIGGTKLEQFMSNSGAMERFKEVYADKTGNEWESRKSFVKHPNKFYPLDIDYGADDEEVMALDSKAGAGSKLPKSVQDLVKIIFDVESMKKAMLEFEIDLKKMPLGKLSKKQIESAYKILTELNTLVETKGTATQFLDASNRFYTLIPHDFGLKKPPILDNPEAIKGKIEMLDNLLEIEVAYSMLKGGSSSEKDPLDVHYEKLNTKIEPLEKSSDEYGRLLDYTKKTHASTHNTYELDVEEIYKVARQGEAKRYRPFKDLHNRMLLWHGSRTTNYAGILSQGLRIAPPEAPVTGYMFGKGVYFADMVSKSANYCRTSKSEPTGILLLCEVALGNMHELTGASYITSLPKGKHSTKGCGMTAPDKNFYHTTSDGVVIPIGEGKDSGIGYSSLLYNEYIVYDVAQIEIKYLLKTTFKYKW